MISNFIEIKYISQKKGKGIFAKEFIEKGTTIDIAHVLLLPEKDYFLIENTMLGNYLFNWEDPQGNSDYKTVILMSFCEFVNHSYNPNCTYEKNYQEKYIKFYAIKDIQAGEELTVNYNGIADDKSPVWFEME
jgi:SET domain-containing protein